MNNYSQITELPGAQVTQEQVLRVYQRYFFASQYSRSRDVLELACGGGGGLSLLAKESNSVTATDIDAKNVERAQRAVINNSIINVHVGDAESLEFQDNSFDVIIFYEAIYYLEDAEVFLRECKRVLRADGVLIIGSANKEWTDFNPSNYSKRYYSTDELQNAMEKKGFEVEMYKGFPIEEKVSFVSIALSLLKRIAVKFHLIPKSMKYKEILKRIFVGKLVKLPTDLSTCSIEYHSPELISPGDKNRQFKVIYAVGRKKD